MAHRASRRSPLTRWLESTPEALFVAFAAFAAFSTYFSTYAFRKPFTSAEYAGIGFGGIDFKTAAVASQIIGYALSKWIGIKVCSETARASRARRLFALILAAEVTLVLFAVLPTALKIGAIFANGLALGIIWGLVVSYLEGRRRSEILLAGLSTSFIVASGAVKDCGRLLMSGLGVTEWWMPAATGLLFLPPFFVSVWLLDRIPDPSDEDVRARVEREPMTRRERIAFLRAFFPGLALLFGAYFLVTAYRDFRDNYMLELFKGLGAANDHALFTLTETFVAFGVLVSLAFLNLIRDNRLGLLGAYAVMASGTLLLGGSTLLREQGLIDGFWWMTLVGLGAYLTYVPYNSLLFDRLIAHTGTIGTAVFAIYVADAIGYIGSVGILVYKDLGQGEMSRLEFFTSFSYALAVIGTSALLLSGAYFLRRRESARAVEPLPKSAETA